MAVTKITSDKLVLNEGGAITATAGTVADGFLLDMKGKDFKTLLMFGGAEGTVTIKAGNAMGGVEGNDLVVNVPETGNVGVVVDSSVYKIVSGDDKGYIKAIPSVAGIKASVILLP